MWVCIFYTSSCARLRHHSRSPGARSRKYASKFLVKRVPVHCACSRRDFICWIPNNSIIVCIFYRIMSKLMVDFTGEDERKRFAMLLPTTARRVHLFDGAFGMCCSLGSRSSCARNACACSLHLWMCQLLHGESHLHVQG